MALIKKCILPSQIEIEYFKVDEMIFRPDSAIVEIGGRGYKSQAAFEAGASPAWIGRIEAATGSAPQLAAGAIAFGELKLSEAIDSGRIGS